MSKIETLTLERHEGLQIREAVGDMLSRHASDADVNQTFLEVVDHIDRADLQLGRIASLYEVRADLQRSLQDDRVEAANGDMTILSALSQNRMRRVGHTARYITRSETEQGIDSEYWDHGSSISIETHLQGQLVTPCIISTFGGNLTVTQKNWHRGEWQYQAVDPDRADKLFAASRASTIWAAYLAMSREPEARDEADAHALQLIDLRLRAT